MFEGIAAARVLTMSDQEKRWFNNIKKAIYESDKAYVEGRPEDRCFEEMCKAVDTAKTLRRSLSGEGYTSRQNKKLFTEFLDFELPPPENGGMNLTLFDSRKGEEVQYSFSSMIYAIRCMIHENENLNSAEQPEFHILLDWSMDPNDRCGGTLDDGIVTLNARGVWTRLREVVTKFVCGLEAMIAIEQGQSFAMRRELCSIRPDALCDTASDDEVEIKRKSEKGWNLRLIAWYACWLIGGLLIAGGLAGRIWLPGFFKVWGRFEMGLLAEFQFYAYGAGMLLLSVPFAVASPDEFEGKEARRFGCLLWLIGAAVFSYLVLDSLPS